MDQTLSKTDQAKRAAAEAAVAQVQTGMLLGLGTGSTMEFAIKALGRRHRDEGLQVSCLPSSERSARSAESEGLRVIGFADTARLDLCIDGADEVETGSLALIKGLGGALLREKIVAINSAHFIVVADSSKIVTRLGEKAPIPVEVTQFGHETVQRILQDMGAGPVLRLAPDGQPYRTDGGNPIYDCLGFKPIENPADMDRTLRALVGVVETGLFLGMANEAFIAEGDTIRHMLPANAASL